MIKELSSCYFVFFKETRWESIIAIVTGIIGAITETIAIYFPSEVINNLEYLRISDEFSNIIF